MKLVRFLFSSVASILIGILFIVYQVNVFDVLVKAIACLIALSAAFSFIKLRWISAAIKLLLGAGLWFLGGGKLLNIALYIVGGILIFYAVVGVINALRHRRGLITLIAGVLSAAICFAFGWFLIFGQGVIAAWAFSLVGVAMIISGVLSLFGLRR